MPGIDWIPGVSQVKSLAQAITGDFDGAARTAENFCRECPVVSQVTSVVQLAAGDADGALETQKMCLGTVNNVANGIPVVGHVKGIVHHAVGDHEGGNQAINAATRSTVVVASGAAAGIATGGIGAIPAGIAAGVGYDATASAVTGDDQGYIAAFKNVAENPSAGAFIDAFAIPVGDGLAGYSGGQIANKIQVNSLESLRLSKLEQMDGAATSGEALKFAGEVKDITAKINTIKHGTPHVFNDPKTGTVAAEASSSTPVVPVSGYVDDQDDQGSPTVCGIAAAAAAASARRMVVAQEDALDYDSYVKVYETRENRKDAQKSLYRRDKKKAEGNILQTYKQSKFTTREQLTDLLGSSGQDPNREPQQLKEILNQLFKWAWLRLVMPKEFPYSVVAQVNSHFGGLYHSFIRHMDQWAEVIPTDIAHLIPRLEPIMEEINGTTAANNRADAEQARTELITARNRLSRGTFNDVQAAMVEIQMAMHDFIQENLTFANYQGRNLNTDGQERLYFKVETPAGTKVMVICLSKEKFEPETGDSRPIRILMTVFFESWAVFRSHGLLETKEEMQNRTRRQ